MRKDMKRLERMLDYFVKTVTSDVCGTLVPMIQSCEDAIELRLSARLDSLEQKIAV